MAWLKLNRPLQSTKSDAFHLTSLSHFWKRLWAFEHSKQVPRNDWGGGLSIYNSRRNQPLKLCLGIGRCANSNLTHLGKESRLASFPNGPSSSVLSCGITEWFAIIIIVNFPLLRIKPFLAFFRFSRTTLNLECHYAWEAPSKENMQRLRILWMWLSRACECAARAWVFCEAGKLMIVCQNSRIVTVTRIKRSQGV